MEEILASGVFVILAGLSVSILIWRSNEGKDQPKSKSVNMHKSAKVETRLQQAGIRIRYGEYLLIVAGSIFLGLLIGVLLNNWMIALFGGFLGSKVPGKYILFMGKKRRDIIDKQLEPALQQIATLYKITRSMEMAIEQAVASMSSPLKGEFLQMLSDIRVAGMNLEEALIRLANRLDLADFHFFAKVALMTQKYGGETRDLMMHVPQTIRERQIIRAELETEIAGAKQQAWLLLAGTPIFFIIYKVLRPDFVTILTGTSPGKIGMAIVALFSFISIILIEKISEPVT